MYSKLLDHLKCYKLDGTQTRGSLSLSGTICLSTLVAALGRCYGLALELQKMPFKTANNFSIFNHRPPKFGMGNDYGLLYRITYRLLVVIIFGDLPQLIWQR